MNTSILEGKWMEMKGRVRSKWGKLTDDDMDEVKGNSEILMGKLQQRYGYAKDRARKDVDDFLNELE